MGFGRGCSSRVSGGDGGGAEAALRGVEPQLTDEYALQPDDEQYLTSRTMDWFFSDCDPVDRPAGPEAAPYITEEQLQEAIKAVEQKYGPRDTWKK